jgi:nitrous oxide reductase accessory protein NosL
MHKILFLLSALLLTLSFSGCEKKSTTAVAKVHWDRDMCARCVMVVSDRVNTVQVRHPDTGKTYMFDDLGCTVLWFEEENIEWKDKAVIWINDNKTGKWINARTAFYDTGNITPMDYGFAAHKEKSSIAAGKEIIRYEEVAKRIIKMGG